MLKEIKEKFTCLDYLGQPAKKTRNGYLYRAPWREDTHPSLSVTANGRGWHDLATGEHGSVIDLVMLHHGCDVSRACEILLRDNPSFSFPQPIQSDCGGREKVAFTRFDVVPLQSRGLFAYLYHRKVNIEIAKRFLVEVRYSTKEPDDGSYIYTLGYRNDKGGYELRNARRKLSNSPKGITTHLGKENAPVVVFEGFMDMLSFATMCGGVKHNYIVLNSCSMKEYALEVLKTLQNQIYLCLDNDKGGDDATAFLLDALPTAADIRRRFAPHKDVNDYLCKKAQQS